MQEFEVDHQTEEMLAKATEKIVGASGARLSRLVLYGSEARGDATPESDIDILAVTDTDDPVVTRQLRDAAYETMWEYDFPRLICVRVMTRGQYESQKREGYSFVLNVEEEGKVLWPAA